MYMSVCVGPGRNPNYWFSHAQAQIKMSVDTSIVIPPGGMITAIGGQRLISQLYVLLMNRGAEIYHLQQV